MANRLLLYLAAWMLILSLTVNAIAEASQAPDDKKTPNDSGNKEEGEERKVSCEKQDDMTCENGGKCYIQVRWSTKHKTILERLGTPACECTGGYSGNNCEVKPTEKSAMSRAALNALICGLSVIGAMLIVLIGVLIYLGYLKKKSVKKQQQQHHQQPRKQQASTASSAASYP